MVVVIGGSVPKPCVWGGGVRRRSIWCADLSCLARSSKQTNEIDQGNQMDKPPATRREMVSGSVFSFDQ